MAWSHNSRMASISTIRRGIGEGITRQAAQARALELAETVRTIETQNPARLQAYADAIRAAQDGGNLSLF